MTSLTKYLKDYKEPSFNIIKVDLTIDLEEDFALVTNIMKIAKKNQHNDNLILDGVNLELIELHVNDNMFSKNDYEIHDDKLILKNLPDEFTVKIINKICPQKNTSLEGLYLADDNLFLTQCESHGFRKITYFIDRPDVMTYFTTKLIASTKFKNLLSNGDLIESGTLKNNKHYAVWHDKWKKPSYLFAAVFGNLEVYEDNFVTKSGRNIKLQIFTNLNDIPKTKYAMFSLKEAMKWDELTYNREYDLDRYMIVGTPKFNSGAMENKGLNIFNNVLILASKDTATDDNFQYVFSVVGHEYFHNWTGNRITLRDWFQLSLKEGLTVFRDQEFSADYFSRPIARINDVEQLRAIQFEEDSGPLAHPVMPQSYVKMDNFYTSTIYDKGAEIIRMLMIIVGKDHYYKALDLYFRRHDGEAVTIEDFIICFEDSCNINLEQFRLWYHQSGTPYLNFSDKFENNEYQIFIEQGCKPTPNQTDKKPFHIPCKIGLIDPVLNKNLDFEYNNQITNEILVQITEKSHSITIKNLARKPILSINRDFTAPVNINYPYSNDDLLKLLSVDNNEFNRWDAGQKFLIDEIIRLSKNIDQPNIKIHTQLVNAIKEVLTNKNLDNAFIANVISLPLDKIIFNHLDEINPIAIYNAKKLIAYEISSNLKELFLNKYHQLNDKLSQKPYEPIFTDIADRSLKNTLLSYIWHSDNELGENIAIEQIDKSDNLTDRIAALKILLNSYNDKIFETYLDQFYQHWKSEDLVILQWIAIQSASRRTDTTARINKLLKSNIFDISIPNMNYSLVRGFINNNVNFHHESGTGYELIANHLINLDKINPAVASRLVKSFGFWKKLSNPYRDLFHNQIMNIKQNHNLSDNLQEMIDSISN